MQSIREDISWRTENQGPSRPEPTHHVLATRRLQKQCRCYKIQLLESPPLNWFDLTGQAGERAGQLESVTLLGLRKLSFIFLLCVETRWPAASSYRNFHGRKGGFCFQDPAEKGVTSGPL